MMIGWFDHEYFETGSCTTMMLLWTTVNEVLPIEQVTQRQFTGVTGTDNVQHTGPSSFSAVHIFTARVESRTSNAGGLCNHVPSQD